LGFELCYSNSFYSHIWTLLGVVVNLLRTKFQTDTTHVGPFFLDSQECFPYASFQKKGISLIHVQTSSNS